MNVFILTLKNDTLHLKAQQNIISFNTHTYFNILSGPLSRVAGENVLISDSARREGLSVRANVIFNRLHEYSHTFN